MEGKTTTKRRAFVRGIAAIGAAAFVPRVAIAQGDVTRLLVGFPAGGAVDIVARTLADALRAPLGRNVIVENRTGAAGSIAVETLIGGPPDGNLLLACPASILTLRPLVESSVRFDPQRDLAPISTAAAFNFGLAVGPTVRAKTLGEFVAWCRQNPDKASYATPGVGTGPHLMAELFARAAGIRIVHVPYRGGAQAMNDLRGGQLPAMFTTLPHLLPPHREGVTRILAITTKARLPGLPDLPTFAEQGVAGMEFEEWIGVFAPARTPAARIRELNKAIVAAVGAETTRTMLTKLEFMPRTTTPEDLAGMIRADNARWRSLIKATGLKLDA